MLLFLFALFCWAASFFTYSADLDAHSRDQMLCSSRINTQTNQLMKFLLNGRIDSLNFALEHIALPRQEAVRYLLLKDIEQNQVPLTLKMKQFIETQQSVKPTYYVMKQGSGYEFSAPAFDYPSIAHRLIRDWKREQNVLDVLGQIEKQQLQLQNWLTGDETIISARESLLIQEIGHLPERSVRFLVQQLTNTPVTSWLPSTRLMSALVKVSHDPELYRLFWLMKADNYSRAEVKRLATKSDIFSVQQMIEAAHNPSLKKQVIESFSRLKPMPDEVKQFLINQMSRSDTARMTAQALVHEGYSDWLKGLILTNQKIKHRIIRQEINL